VTVTVPLTFSPRKYASFLRLVGYPDVPSSLPITYPIVEAFRLVLLVLAHPDFPFSVLGSVLARNKIYVATPLSLESPLIHRWGAGWLGGGEHEGRACGQEIFGSCLDESCSLSLDD
jgi:hypothetical protein